MLLLLLCRKIELLIRDNEGDSSGFQYNIKKKEEVQEAVPQEEPNPLMRKKKTPEELAAEAEAEDEDEFTSKRIAHISTNTLS